MSIDIKYLLRDVAKAALELDRTLQVVVKHTEDNVTIKRAVADTKRIVAEVRWFIESEEF